MKTAFLWLILMGCFLAPAGPPENRPEGQRSFGLEFTATPKSDTFEPNDKVVFVFQVRNRGKRDVLVSRRFPLDRHVLLHILDPSGKEVPWCGKVDGSIVSAKDFAVLRPGASLSRAVAVSCQERKMGGYRISSSGKYSVVARYHLTEPLEVLKQFAADAEVVRGPITAPQVYFWIGSRPPSP